MRPPASEPSPSASGVADDRELLRAGTATAATVYGPPTVDAVFLTVSSQFFQENRRYSGVKPLHSSKVVVGAPLTFRK